MQTVNIHEAKTNLSKLIVAAVAGEPFVIAKAGKRLVTVTRLEQDAKPASRRVGFMKGQIKVPDDFDTMGAAEIEAMF